MKGSNHKKHKKRKKGLRVPFAPFVLLVVTSLLAVPPSTRLSTWTIAATDPATGDVGVAGASCVPGMHIDAIAALVPGKGVATVQAFWDLENRNKVYELLRGGASADEIVRRVANRAFDGGVEDRQYGVITIGNGSAKVAAFTGKETIAWAGSQHDAALGVSVQGNILVGPDVVGNALQSFKSEKMLSDRLMRALEAGSAAGGDSRCNNSRVRQTASSAFILVARGGDSPYAAKDLGITDQGTSRAPWLAISVKETAFGRNPVVELRKRYDEWRRKVVLQ